MVKTAILGLALASLLAGAPAQAATLESPANGGLVSGIGVIRGWKCTAGELTVRFNGGSPLPLAYGNARQDVLNSGACPHNRVGFVSIMNWGELGDGQHTAVAYDNGVAFAQATFHVVAPGPAFLRGVTGTGTATLSNGQQATLSWSEASQSFVVTEWTSAEPLSFNPYLSFGPDNWNGVSSHKLVERLEPAYLLLMDAFGLTEPNYPLEINPHNGGPRLEIGSVGGEKTYRIRFRLYGDDLNERYVIYVHDFTHELAHSANKFRFLCEWAA